MKFAWVVEGPYLESGSYSQQINLISGALHEGWGIESTVANVPSMSEPRQQMLLIDSLRHYKPDFMVSYGDLHIFGLPEIVGCPMLSWVFQGAGDVGFTHPWDGVTFGCISNYCYQKVVEFDPTAVYVPHAYDPEVFQPGSREASRAYLGIEHEGPIIAMVGTNYGDWRFEYDRKNWAGALDAFALLHERRPEVRLYLHTNDSVEGGFITITDHAEKLGIENAIILADQSHFTEGVGWDYPQEHIAQVYNAADVLLMPSVEEGFGLPLIEAQACGIPVVTTAAGPMKELAVSGTAVEPVGLRPAPEDLVKALEHHLFIHRMSRQSVARDIEQYSVQKVVTRHFYPAIEQTLA